MAQTIPAPRTRIDDSPVEDERLVKQVSQEVTFVKDISDAQQPRATILELSEGVACFAKTT
jgi:hypothetical protein